MLCLNLPLRVACGYMGGLARCISSSCLVSVCQDIARDKWWHVSLIETWDHGLRRRRSNGFLLLLLWWTASTGNATELDVIYNRLFLATVREMCTACWYVLSSVFKTSYYLEWNKYQIISNNTMIMLLYEFW